MSYGNKEKSFFTRRKLGDVQKKLSLATRTALRKKPDEMLATCEDRFLLFI